jgi:hypothetical protein
MGGGGGGGGVGESWPGEKEIQEALSGLVRGSGGVSASRVKDAAKVALANSREFKRVVYEIERFIRKSRPRDRVAGVYVIDAVVKESRSKSGEKDHFESRFTQRMKSDTLPALRAVPESDMHSIKRVLDGWVEKGLFGLSASDIAGLGEGTLDGGDSPDGGLKSPNRSLLENEDDLLETSHLAGSQSREKRRRKGSRWGDQVQNESEQTRVLSSGDVPSAGEGQVAGQWLQPYPQQGNAAAQAVPYGSVPSAHQNTHLGYGGPPPPPQPPQPQLYGNLMHQQQQQHGQPHYSQPLPPAVPVPAPHYMLGLQAGSHQGYHPPSQPVAPGIAVNHGGVNLPPQNHFPVSSHAPAPPPVTPVLLTMEGGMRRGVPRRMVPGQGDAVPSTGGGESRPALRQAKMCLTVGNGTTCRFGNLCHFAHSEEELRNFSAQKQMGPASFATAHFQPPGATAPAALPSPRIPAAYANTSSIMPTAAQKRSSMELMSKITDDNWSDTSLDPED